MMSKAGLSVRLISANEKGLSIAATPIGSTAQTTDIDLMVAIKVPMVFKILSKLTRHRSPQISDRIIIDF